MLSLVYAESRAPLPGRIAHAGPASDGQMLVMYLNTNLHRSWLFGACVSSKISYPRYAWTNST